MPISFIRKIGTSAETAAIRNESVTLLLSKVEESALKKSDDRPNASIITP